jgi:hypothetical protein
MQVTVEKQNQTIVDCHVTHIDMEVPKQDPHLLNTLQAGYYNEIFVYMQQYQQVPLPPRRLAALMLVCLAILIHPR